MEGEDRVWEDGERGKREDSESFSGESESLWGEREGRDGIVPFSNYEFR